MAQHSVLSKSLDKTLSLVFKVLFLMQDQSRAYFSTSLKQKSFIMGMWMLLNSSFDNTKSSTLMLSIFNVQHLGIDKIPIVIVFRVGFWTPHLLFNPNNEPTILIKFFFGFSSSGVVFLPIWFYFLLNLIT